MEAQAGTPFFSEISSLFPATVSASLRSACRSPAVCRRCDRYLLCLLYTSRFGQFGTTSMADENILAMRQLCRYRDSVISSRTEIKLRIGTIMAVSYTHLDVYKRQA